MRNQLSTDIPRGSDQSTGYPTDNSHYEFTFLCEFCFQPDMEAIVNEHVDLFDLIYEGERASRADLTYYIYILTGSLLVSKLWCFLLCEPFSITLRLTVAKPAAWQPGSG